MSAPSEQPIHTLPAGPVNVDRKTMVVFLVATVLIVVFQTYALPGRFAGTDLHADVLRRLGDGYREYFALLPYQWWGVMSLVLRVAVPLAVIVWVLRERPGEWGFRLRGQWPHIRPYVYLFAVMVPILFAVSFTGPFQSKYPLYPLAVQGGWHFWGWQLFYGMQFLGLEAFFRGFMTFGLWPRLGWYAIPVMTIPYTMVHFGKPTAEVFAAIVAGLVLGYLAIRSRSFLWGFFLHWAVAITMDVLVIGQEFGFSRVWEIVF